MNRRYDIEKLPDVETYITGLKAIRPRMRPEHFRVFQAQYDAPSHTATATDIAHAAGITGGHAVVNGLYGGLGHKFCDATGFIPELRPDDSARWWAVWSIGHSTKKQGFLWEMRPQVIEALQSLGWVHGPPVMEEIYREDQERKTAQALHSSEAARLRRIENAPPHPPTIRILRSEFQRNPDIVASVLLAAKGHCDLCGTAAPFSRGSDGSPYLEVHHIISLSEGGEDTLRNTVALCPNCHREVHHGKETNELAARLHFMAESRLQKRSSSLSEK